MKHLFRVNPLGSAGLFLIFFGIGFIVEYFDVNNWHYLLLGIVVLIAAVVLFILSRAHPK